MTTLRNWLRCLVTFHRYDITSLDLQRLVYCECCGRELFNRRAPILKSLVTHPDIPFTGGEGQTKEEQEEQNQQPMDAADAAHIIKAINSGRLGATTGAAIASPRNSLDDHAQPRFILCTGQKDFLSSDVGIRRFTAIMNKAAARQGRRA